MRIVEMGLAVGLGVAAVRVVAVAREWHHVPLGLFLTWLGGPTEEYVRSWLEFGAAAGADARADLMANSQVAVFSPLLPAPMVGAGLGTLAVGAVAAGRVALKFGRAGAAG